MVTRPNIDSKGGRLWRKKASNHTPPNADDEWSLAFHDEQDSSGSRSIQSWLPVGQESDRNVRPFDGSIKMSLFRAVLVFGVR